MNDDQPQFFAGYLIVWGNVFQWQVPCYSLVFQRPADPALRKVREEAKTANTKAKTIEGSCFFYKPFILNEPIRPLGHELCGELRT